MECNKEEAVRAKEEAERKMEIKEFEAAHRLALRAQRLYPSLENLSQLLLVCNVHCSAERKLFGNEYDWYGILQIEQTADETTIKKQYKKLALQLHPDKNKFPGAEAAFKLIGEAQRLLLDTSKRYYHDMKRKATPAYRAPQKPNWNANAKNGQGNFSGVNRQHFPQQPAQPGFFNVQSNVRGNPPGLNRQHYQSQQPAQSNGRSTFWTKCSFCQIRYQYYRDLLGRSLTCQICKKAFVAIDIGVAAAPTSTYLSQPARYQKKDVPNRAGSRAGVNFGGNASSKESEAASFKKTVNESRGSSGKETSKRRRMQVSDSSEDDDNDSSSDSEDNVAIDEDGNLHATKDFGCYAEYPRRSTRQKQKVSYNYNDPLSDDDDEAEAASSPKQEHLGEPMEEDGGKALKQEKLEKNKQPAATEVKGHRGTEDEDMVKYKKLDEKEASGEDCSKEGLEADNDSSAPDAHYHKYAVPEFNDFSQARREECFAAGQVWALYDTLDGMPRCYAQIKKVCSPVFKLEITWLEVDPEDNMSAQWMGEGLPVSCGKFKHGRNEVKDSCLLFSHPITCVKGGRRNTFMIYPRKGEVWAVFKNWDPNWIHKKVAHSEYEYEFVEILSNYAYDVGVNVAYMGRVKGFAFLFFQEERNGDMSSLIPSAELLRFSHRIPSIKMTGEEREGVPKGSFELDPSSLPSDLQKAEDTEDPEMKAGSTHPDSSESVSACQTVNSSSEDLEEDVKVPDPEFHNFDDERSVESFQVGEIWSVYSDEDGLAKYYGQIKNICPRPGVALEITWLEIFKVPDGTIQWSDKDIPISCGIFKLMRKGINSYNSTDAFSHRVAALECGRNVFEIFPRKGDIWALYRDWRPEMSCSELGDCKYDIVHVHEVTDATIHVMALERVQGFKTIFKPCIVGGSPIVSTVYQVELFRFSHQIPAFQLSDERNGSLRGYWELDPQAFPVSYFSSK